MKKLIKWFTFKRLLLLLSGLLVTMSAIVWLSGWGLRVLLPPFAVISIDVTYGTTTKHYIDIPTRMRVLSALYHCSDPLDYMTKCFDDHHPERYSVAVSTLYGRTYHFWLGTEDDCGSVYSPELDRTYTDNDHFIPLAITLSGYQGPAPTVMARYANEK